MYLRARLATLPTWLGLACVACQEPPRIGVVLPETGAAAVYGASLRSGINLAVSGARSREEGSFEVLFRDSGSDPARAASACEALYENGALVVIGGATSAEAKAMIPVADRHGRVLLSPSASAPELGRHSAQFLRVYPSDTLEGRYAAELLVARQPGGSVLILSEDNDYARGLLPVFVERLRALGAQMLGPESLDVAGWEPRVRAILLRQSPHGVYICGYGEAIARGLQVLRAAGFGGLVCATSAIHSTALLQRLGREAEGLLFPLATADLSGGGEPARGFVRSYRQAYNLEPDIFASYGYDAVLATVAALAVEPSPSPGRFAGTLRGLRGVRGVMGPLRFDAEGNVNPALRTHRIRGGHVEVVPDPAPPSAGSAPPGGAR